MRIRIILSLVGMAFTGLLSAQITSPEIISPAGGIDQTQTISLEWTIGETAVEGIYSKNSLITQGFHQPILTVEALPIESNETDPQVSAHVFQVFPNPVESVLEVTIKSPDLEPPQLLILIDADGQMILQQEVDLTRESQYINMRTYASGVYFLQCLDQDDALIKSFKIIKSQ